MIYEAQYIPPACFKDFLKQPCSKKVELVGFEHAEYFNKLISFDFDMKFVGTFDDTALVEIDESDNDVAKWATSRFIIKEGKYFLFESDKGTFIHINASFFALSNGLKFNTGLRELDMRLLEPQTQFPLLNKKLYYDYKGEFE